MRNHILCQTVRQLDILDIIFWFSFKVMYLGENNCNLSEAKKCFLFQPFLKQRKFLLDMRKDFLITSNFYLVEILSKPNSLTIVTSKKILKMSNYVLILSIFSHNENQEFAVSIQDIFTNFKRFANNARFSIELFRLI